MASSVARLSILVLLFSAATAPFPVEAVRVSRQQGPVGSLIGANQAGRAAQLNSSAELLKGMRDGDVFVQIGDNDKVTWGMLHNHIDAAMNTRISSLFAAARGDQMDGVRFGLYQQALTKTLRKYLGASVMAYEAKKLGMKVPTANFDTQIAELKKKYPNPSNFQYQFLTNAVYMQEYVEKQIKPLIKVSDAALTNLIARRHMENLSVPATNALLKAKIEAVRAKIANGELSFAEAAEDESDCVDCCSNGGDCGTWEEDIDNIATNLLKACFSLPVNVLSEVVETPEAFHLVKVTSKYEPTKKAREEDGEVSSVDVRHIQVDKWMPEPEFTKDTAREFLERRLLSRMVARRQYELLDTTPIKSVIQLRGKGDDVKAEKVRRVLESARRSRGRL